MVAAKVMVGTFARWACSSLVGHLRWRIGVILTASQMSCASRMVRHRFTMLLEVLEHGLSLVPVLSDLMLHTSFP